MRIIKTGVDGKYYEVLEYKPFTEDDILNDLIHENGSIVISQYGLSQIVGIFTQQNDTESIPHIKILYGNICKMASVMSIVEFMRHSPILVKLKEVENQNVKDVDKMPNIFPFFKICDYNLCVSDKDIAHYNRKDDSKLYRDQIVYKHSDFKVEVDSNLNIVVTKKISLNELRMQISDEDFKKILTDHPELIKECE